MFLTSVLRALYRIEPWISPHLLRVTAGSMGGRRRWGCSLARIVLEGLKGKPVADLCQAPQLRQAPYDPWRGQCLAHAANALEVHAQRQREARLMQETARLHTHGQSAERMVGHRDGPGAGARLRVGLQRGGRLLSTCLPIPLLTPLLPTKKNT